MRVDARNAGTHHGWYVWHCEELREVKHCVWVDDTLNQWGECNCQLNGLSIPCSTFEQCYPETRQAKKILIFMSRLLVLINPIADSTDEGVEDVVRKDIELALSSK